MRANVQWMMFVFICALVATTGVVHAALDSEVNDQFTRSLGCGPECAGTCFAGNCLFNAENVDDANSFRSAKLGWPEASLVQQPQLPGLAGSFRSSGLGSSGFLASREEQLSLELGQVKADEAQLQAENAGLRRELARWKETGAHIAEREAKVVQILSKPKAQQQQTHEALAQASAVSHTSITLQPSSLLQGFARRFWTSSNGTFTRVFTICGIIVAVLVLCRVLYNTIIPVKGDGSWSSKLVQVLSNSPYKHRLQPMLLRMGLAEYKVEVSEIHLGSFFAGCNDIRVIFRMGNGTERRTKVLKNSGGAFLRFDDILELSLSSTDAPCALCVGDRQGDLAQFDLAAAEIIRLATRPHQEYFRTELRTCRSSSGDGSGRRPYIALRIRNITAADIPTEASHLKPGAGFAA